jgi:NADH-quinone oxidoreductase subunit N
MNDQLQDIYQSMKWLMPELLLTSAILITLFVGLFVTKNKHIILKSISLLVYAAALVLVAQQEIDNPVSLFGNMLRADNFSNYFKMLFLTGGLLTVWISQEQKEKKSTEYFILIQAVVTGSCLLAMSMNFIMVVLSIELISLSSYMLSGFGFDKKSAEGSLKYFLFGTVATACMIYGMSLLYSLSGTLDFSSETFLKNLLENKTPLLLVGGILTLAGLLFKISAVPFHLWAPDVYEATPTPIVAFFAVVPKLAGLAIITRFTLAINLFGQSGFNWQLIIAVIAAMSILVGNLSALAQKNPKRLLAFSSVAQAGFMLLGIVSFSTEGIQFTMFYAAVFLLMNFLVFIALNQIESAWGAHLIPAFAGTGKIFLIPALTMLVGLIALTGLPPTAGFTAKLLIFSSLWASYEQSGSLILLFVFIVGLLNTVISLFFYLKIPYYQFIKEKKRDATGLRISFAENLLTILLAIALFYLFLHPDGLMRWINRISFVL